MIPAQLQYLLVIELLLIGAHAEAYFATCEESEARVCGNTDNRTEFLESMKKGGPDVLSTDVYLYEYLLCEEFNYDCGFLEDEASPITISNGISLDITEEKL